MSRTRIVVLGAAGRMGGMLTATALQDPEIEVVGGVDRAGLPEVGRDLGQVVGGQEIGVSLTSSLESAIDLADVTIEFTTPDATLEHLAISKARGKPAVVGTTGFSAPQIETVDQIAKSIPLFMAPNMSLGVNLLFKILPLVAATLGTSYDVEIVETHHHGKMDAPSGTALRLGEVVAEAQGTKLSDRAVYGRQGIQPRKPGEIGMHAIRLGSVVGDHSVYFVNEGEQIEIAHRAFSRQTFALGALRAAKWIVSQKPGRYSMQDLIG